VTTTLTDDASGNGIERFGAIGAFLRTPAEAVDLAAFCARFQASRIRVRLDGMAPAATDLALAGRLRGALGNVLVRTASPETAAGKPCPWDPPSAFEALFRKQGRMTPGTDFPSPWVIGVTPRHGDLEVTLTLFGIATEWAPAAAEAMVDACARVDWPAAAKVFVPAARAVERRVDRVTIADLPNDAGAVALTFLSPLVGSSKNPVEAPASAFTSLGLRLEGLARWHGLTLAPVDWRALAGLLVSAAWMWSEADIVTWQRGSQRQDKWIGMKGVLGSLHVEADPATMRAIAPLLQLGRVAHVGADIAFGCGRYRIT
jgi:hypothetical protein